MNSLENQIAGLRWAGHVVTMSDSEMSKELLIVIQNEKKSRNTQSKMDLCCG
jgi:hypothetical protein